MFRNLFIIALLGTAVGCTWVQLTSAGENVSLRTASQVANCERIGRTQTQSLSRVTIVERGADRLQEELLTLARNEAGDMGGNVVVAESVITEGRQSFGVYQCP